MVNEVSRPVFHLSIYLYTFSQNSPLKLFLRPSTTPALTCNLCKHLPWCYGRDITHTSTHTTALTPLKSSLISRNMFVLLLLDVMSWALIWHGGRTTTVHQEWTAGTLNGVCLHHVWTAGTLSRGCLEGLPHLKLHHDPLLYISSVALVPSTHTKTHT